MQFLHMSISMLEKFNRQPWFNIQPWVTAYGAMVVACLALVSNGCNEYSAAEHRVDPEVAHQTLKKVLVCWQQGDLLEDCLKLTPPVVVQDPDWISGSKLIAFEVVAPGEPRDANYYCQVKLSFETSQQPGRSQTVTYLVGTSPVLTVFRSPGP